MQVKNTHKPIDYSDSMKILEKRVKDVFNGKKDELLWILEHKTVYTAGTSSKNEDVLDRKLKILKTNRGGKHTLHAPGQKVIYFVINLKVWNIIRKNSFYFLNTFNSIYLIKGNLVDNNKKYELLSLLQYNIDLHPDEIINYLKKRIIIILRGGDSSPDPPPLGAVRPARAVRPV